MSETMLREALQAEDELIRQAQGILWEYLVPGNEPDGAAALRDLVLLFDGPEQRNAQRLAARALAP
jgi:hypothetical protein